MTGQKSSSERPLEGKAVIVIGGAGGAGSGFAKYFARVGAQVLVNDVGYGILPGSGDYDLTKRSPFEAERVTDAIRREGGVAHADYEDASDPTEAKQIVEHCLDLFGRVDVVIHAANVSRLGMAESLSDSDWDEVIRQNLYPAFYLTRDTIPHMRRQGSGRHIYLGSATVREMWGGVNYAAASGGIYSLMRSIALEYGRENITANSLEPWTQTKTGQRPSGKRMLEERTRVVGYHPKEHESLPPGEVNAPLGAYLCTEEGGYFNGQYFSTRYGRICIFSTPNELRYLYRDYGKEGNWTVDELTRVWPAAFEGAIQPLWHPRV